MPRRGWTRSSCDPLTVLHWSAGHRFDAVSAIRHNPGVSSPSAAPAAAVSAGPGSAGKPLPDRTQDRQSVGQVQTQTVTLATAADPLQLTSGETLGPIEVAFETYGELSPEADNAIFVCQTLTSDAHAAGWHAPTDPKPGWWDALIGPGKTLDTTEYFVISANALGGCRGTTGPASTNPATGRPWGPDFPFITIDDIVAVHRRLCRHLGVARPHAVIGGSLGGMQTLAWAAADPDAAAAFIVLASAARLSSQGIAFNSVARRAIMADPRFADGRYYAEDEKPDFGLALARMIAHITYLSEKSIETKFGRRRQTGSEPSYKVSQEIEFQIESYLHYQGRRFVERFDANSYLLLTRAMDYFDLLDRGSLADTLGRSGGRFFIGSYDTDWLFPPWQSEEIVRDLLASGRDVTYSAFTSPFGHDAFLLEVSDLEEVLIPFLQNVR